MTEPTLTLTAERPVAGGLMLARHDGKVVLLSGAIPGERVRARIDRSTKQVIFARTVDVIEASPFRRPVVCDPACGGLAYAHVAYAHQLDLKAQVLADTFRRVGKIVLDEATPVCPSPEDGYRMRARLHIRQGRAGFFREGSRELCDAGASRQLTSDALAAAQRLVVKLGSAADGFEAMTLSENVSGSERVAHLETADERTGQVPEAVGLPEGLTGVTMMQRGTVATMAGVPSVRDRVADLCPSGSIVPSDVAWSRSAAAFFQGNRYLTGTLLSHVIEHAHGDRAIDLYSGVGLFAVGLAARGAAVLAVEGDPIGRADLVANSRAWTSRLTMDPATSVEAALEGLAPGAADVVVVDPPRTGLSKDALAGLIRLRAPRIIYVSCDPPTLARDAHGLMASGYAISGLDAFDMFPNTPHIEAVCIFDREGSA